MAAQRIRLLVNYKNGLGLWNTEAETITRNRKNDYITAETFASWIGEIYLSRGCSEVVCIEINGELTKAAMKDLGSIDISFISENFKKMLGKRWTFIKDGLKA